MQLVLLMSQSTAAVTVGSASARPSATEAIDRSVRLAPKASTRHREREVAAAAAPERPGAEGETRICR